MVGIEDDFGSRAFAWCIGPLHMHRRIIMSHNVVTEIKKMLTQSKIGTVIAFHRDVTSQIPICLSLSPLIQEAISITSSKSSS
jgi:hypothetical protein